MKKNSKMNTCYRNSSSRNILCHFRVKNLPLDKESSFTLLIFLCFFTPASWSWGRVHILRTNLRDMIITSYIFILFEKFGSIGGFRNMVLCATIGLVLPPTNFLLNQIALYFMSCVCFLRIICNYHARF